MDKARDDAVVRIKAIEAELKNCKKGTPHYRDINRHLQREKKQLMIYDRYRREYKDG